jgi:hypothetical protein
VIRPGSAIIRVRTVLLASNVSASATITPDGSQQLVFFQGTNNLLTEDWYALGSWHGPMQFGAISSPPSVTVTPDGSTQLVFSKTAAGHLQESWYTLGSWNGPIDWTTSAFAGNGLLTSSPSATVTVDGSTQIVFWQGAASGRAGTPSAPGTAPSTGALGKGDSP